MELTGKKKVYFIGIGGIGMSAAAGIAKAKGFKVSGSDSSDVYEPSKGILDKYKIDYKIGYSADNFDSADLVVAGAAIDQTNPEYAKAAQMNIQIVSFPEFLAELAKDKKRIVVVGTHGKGTTSGLLGFAFNTLDDSSFFVGAVLNNLQTNFHYGAGPYFILEGDEYKSSHDDLTPKFNYYKPDILLINNIEFDHPDIYKNLKDVQSAFAGLIKLMPKNGLIVYNSDDPNVNDLISDVDLNKISFGFNANADVRAELPVLNGQNFDLQISYKDQTFKAQTAFPGMPYAYDNLAAISVLLALGFPPQTFLKSVREYKGVKRRYEIIYDKDITIIDDYAHHPTAIRQTLEATRAKFPDRRIICFFEPHTYSRTKETLNELAQAFGEANQVFLAEVYPAREQKLSSSITGKQVVAEIAKYQLNVSYVADKQNALDQFKKTVKRGDVVIVMAVGSFNTLVYDLMKVHA